MCWSFSVPVSEASMKEAELSALLPLATGSQLSVITCGAGKQSRWVIWTFLHRNPPPLSRVFSLAFSTNCKLPHKCKTLELINSPVLILPRSRKSIALPDLQAAHLDWRCKSSLPRNRNIPERIYYLYFKIIFWNVIHCMYACFKKQMLNSSVVYLKKYFSIVSLQNCPAPKVYPQNVVIKFCVPLHLRGDSGVLFRPLFVGKHNTDRKSLL